MQRILAVVLFLSLWPVASALAAPSPCLDPSLDLRSAPGDLRLQFDGEPARAMFDYYLGIAWRGNLMPGEKCVVVYATAGGFSCVRTLRDGVFSYVCGIVGPKDEPTSVSLPGMIGIGN